ncbi:conserved hypothetical protein [Ricinus communis]|uniref:Uncharacterized protein n=1 Tax=Ricinus communis TaxID=3988 RepID=B9SUB7_RICCO|nr:conserved hypothetical protein [Ricinus communis]
MFPFNLNVMKNIRLVDIGVGQYILKEPTYDIPIYDNPEDIHHKAPSSSSSAPRMEATLPYHYELLHWLCDSVSNLCYIQGISMAPRPMFHSYSATTVTE